MYQLYTNNRRITGPMPKDEAEEKAARLKDEGLEVEVRQCLDSKLLEIDDIEIDNIFDKVNKLFKRIINE